MLVTQYLMQKWAFLNWILCSVSDQTLPSVLGFAAQLISAKDVS